MTTKIQWKKLLTHDGSAAEVPAIVTSLLSGGDAEKHTLTLEQLFINDAQTCSAAGPTVALLLSQLSSAGRPEWVLRAAANVAGGDWLQAWLKSPNAVPDEIAQTLHEYRSELWQVLDHQSVEVRSAAAFVLSGAPALLAREAQQRLLQRLEVETDAQVIAGCLLTLSRLDSTPTLLGAIERFQSASSRLVRGAWGVAQLRMGESISGERVAGAVVDWLAAFVDVSPTGFWWWAPTVRFAAQNTFLEKRLQHGIVLAEMAKAGLGETNGSALEAWTQFLVTVPSRTEDGWAYRGASDFLRYVYETLQIEHRGILTPAQLTPAQHVLALRLEASPLCAEAGHGFPATGAVRSRWLGNATPSVLEQLLVATATGVDGQPGKVPLYWAKARRVLGKPAIPELDSLQGFDRWRVLVSEAFGEYSPNWLPPDLAEIEACIDQACADPRMVETLASLTDECAARVREFRRQHLAPKYWAISALLLVRPLRKHGIAWKAAWESLISMEGDPDAWARELIEWIPAEVRERWLWDNPMRLRFELHYVDLLPSARLAKRSLASIHNARKAGRQLIASTLQVEQAILELAKTSPIFARAVEELNVEVGLS